MSSVALTTTQGTVRSLHRQAARQTYICSGQEVPEGGSEPSNLLYRPPSVPFCTLQLVPHIAGAGPPLDMLDHISIPDLVVHLPTGLGPSYSAFGISPAPACPVGLSLRIDMHDGIVQGDDDTMLGLGVNYSTVSKEIYALVSGVKTGAGAPFTPPTWEGHEALMRAVAAVPLALTAVKGVHVGLTLERAALYGKYVRYSAYYDAEQGSSTGAEQDSGRRETSVECNEINVTCVVGLHPHERKERQRLELDLKVQPDISGLSTKDLVGAAVEECLTDASTRCCCCCCHRSLACQLMPSTSSRVAMARSSPSRTR